jgi:hypothetical protein
VFSKLLANDLVSVQAMNLPIGKLFYFIPKTSDRTPELTGGLADAGGNLAGTGVGPSNHAEMFVATCVQDNIACDVSQFSDCLKNLYDRFYNDEFFDHSKGQITVKIGTGTAVTWTACSTGMEFAPGSAPAAADGTLRNQIMEVTGFNQVSPGRLVGPDGNEMDTESFLASFKAFANTTFVDGDTNTIFTQGDEIPFRIVTQRYGKGIVDYGDICTPDGKIYIELDLTHPACITCDSANFDGYTGADYTGTTFTSSDVVFLWHQYADLELESQMGEVSFELESVTVSVTERKLRATWTPELAQDVSAFHNIDAEAELTALLSEQVAAEIDREILIDLRKGAAWTLRWDYNGWKRLGQVNAAYTQKEWNQTLMTAINQVSAQIHKSTLRGGANWVVVSSEVSAVLDDLEYFHVSNASPEQDQYNMGIERVGSLQGRYTVYRDPYAPAYSVLIGHKGKSLLDTGYIYAPYVPLQLTPTMYNPFNFVPVKGIMTRYAKKMVNNRFYGHIRVDGLRTFDVRELR